MALEFLDSPFFKSKSDDGFLENIKQGDHPGYLQNISEGLRDEFLGVDDFSRSLKYATQGNFLKAAKSFLAGNLELGSSALMFVPGANIFALAAKAGKLGKLGKILKFLGPLSKQEQVVARTARARGLRPKMFSSPERGLLPKELIGRNIELLNVAPTRGKLSQLVSQLPDPIRRAGRTLTPKEIGMGRGGYAGSFTRGIAQLAGLTPTAQGPLANRAYMARSAEKTPSLAARTGEKLSGRLGIPFQRSERDELAQLLPGVGGGEINPLDAAILELIMRANSPSAAY